MTDSALVSIIVPVYNVEKYLERCIESLKAQIYKRIEIVLVDDGSTDACPSLCDFYGEQNERITVIHQKNGGLAAARNTGINNAKGKYITFVDSDDYVTKFYVENLVSAIKKENSDLSISMFVNVIDGEEKKKHEGTNHLMNYRLKDNKGCLKDMLYQRGIETSAPGKLFIRSKIGGLRFPEGKLYEDIMFTTAMISRSEKVAIIDNIDYLYYQRSGSIQYQNFNKQKMDCIWHSREMIKYVSKRFPDLEKAAYVRYFGGLCNIIFQIPDDAYEEERLLIWNDIKKYRGLVLFDKNARKKSKVAAILSYLGFGVMKYAYSKTQLRGQVKLQR